MGGNKGVARYSNLEIYNVNYIEIRNMPDGDLEITLINEPEKLCKLMINKSKVKNTIIMIDGSVDKVDFCGNLFVLGNCNISNINGTILKGDGNLKGLDDKEADMTYKISAIGARCRLEEIENHKDSVLKVSGNLKNIYYVHNKNNAITPINIYVKKNIGKATVNGKVYAALDSTSTLTVKNYLTDYIYMKPCRLAVAYVKKECNYVLYVKECEIEYKNIKTLNNTIQRMKNTMGKMELIEKPDNKVLWVNKNIDGDIVENIYSTFNLFSVIESYYLRTNLWDGYFFNNNINFRLLIDKSELMESDIVIKGKKLSKSDKEKLVDMFICELRKDIASKYIIGKAKGKDYRYYKESTSRGIMFSLDFFEQ